MSYTISRTQYSTDEEYSEACQRMGQFLKQRERKNSNMFYVTTPTKADGYKTGHRQQYPENTSLVYSNFCPRKSRVEGIDYMRFFGLQSIMQGLLVDDFNVNFFDLPKYEVVNKYKRRMDYYIGKDKVPVDHIAALHDLGYLPLNIDALPEGTKVPMNVPAMTMWNSPDQPEFYWLTNYIETIISNKIWLPCTSATTAGVFKERFDHWAEVTGADKSFTPFQGHDFSYRGMADEGAAMASGGAHLIPFVGTDTIPAIDWLEYYYDADVERELVGCSVPATEHSVMCAGGKEGELETLRRLLEDVYPTGIVSVVSDTWDFWQLITEFLPAIKELIINRWEKDPESKLVIRPDSGVPHLILNGDPNADTWYERAGLMECLGMEFGFTMNDRGYRKIHPCVGAIYGDGINFDEQEKILSGLARNGFESTSVVLGLGSYTYQYVTRDTFGTVCKATYCEIDGEGRELFKDPKTGGWKKSHRGLLRVEMGEEGNLVVKEGVSWDEQGGLMVPVMRNGRITKRQTLSEVRETFKNQ